MPEGVYYTATTLDGYIADEHDSLQWLFEQQTGEQDGGPPGYDEFIGGIGALVMGATTYEWVRAHMEREGESWAYEQPTWVFTHRDLPPVPGVDVRFASGDVRPVHVQAVAAAGGKNVWLVGGGDLVGQFHDAGLLDEIIVQIGSVTLGAGRPLLPRMIAFPPMELQSVRQVGAGFAELRYAVPRAGVAAGADASSTRTSSSGA